MDTICFSVENVDFEPAEGEIETFEDIEFEY